MVNLSHIKAVRTVTDDVQIVSGIEYLIQTDNILVLLLRSNLL